MKTNICKKLVLSFIYLLSIALTNAQIPLQIPFQGVLRNGQSEPMQGTFALRLSINNNSANGTLLYQETHSIMTNNLGLFTVNVGGGSAISGLFENIDWGNGYKFVKIEIDTNNSNTYIDMGTTQILSVPYALYSGRADSTLDSRWSILGSDIFNSNSGNVGIGLNNPGNKLAVKGGLSIGDSAASLPGPPGGLRVDGRITIGNDPLVNCFTCYDGGFIVIDDGRVRRYKNAIRYAGITDSTISNTGLDFDLSATDTVTGSSMKLYGLSNSARVVGNKIEGSGSEIYFVGTETETKPYNPVGPAIWPRLAIGAETRITASDSAFGSRIFVNNANASTIVRGITLASDSSDGSVTNWKPLFELIKTNDGWKNSIGSDLVLGGIESVYGQRLSLTAGSNTANVNGIRILPNGNGNKFRGFSLSCIPEIDDEVLVIGTFLKAVGADIHVAASDSVTGVDITVDNNSSSTKINGLRIKAGPNAILADTSSKKWCLKLLTNDDAWKNNTGSDLVLGGSLSGIGHKVKFIETGDSALITGFSVFSEGAGKKFIAFKSDPYAEDGAREIKYPNVAVGSYLHVEGKDSTTGSEIVIDKGNDETKIAGLKISLGPNSAIDSATKLWNLTLMKTDDSWKTSTGSKLVLGGEDTVMASRINLIGLNDSTKMYGEVLTLSGLGKKVTGRQTYIRTGSVASDGIGDACDNVNSVMRNFTGSQFNIYSVSQQAKGVSVEVDGMNWQNGSRITALEAKIHSASADTVRGLHIQSNGTNINIGSEINVQGGIQNTGLHILADGTGVSGFFEAQNGAHALLAMGGNVGIHNLNPVNELDVTGDINVSSVSGKGGFLIDDAASPGTYLRGNGTRYTSSSLLANDLTGVVPYSSLPVLSGDASGALNNITVDKIKNYAVSSTVPADGQVLKFNLPLNQWEPSTDLTSGGIAGGDLSGSFPNPTVSKIQGVQISTSLPANGNVLKYNSTTSQWEPADCPPHVAFEAGLQAGQVIMNNVQTTVLFNLTTFNDGSNYNPVTGIFTAPSTGKYHFDAGIMWQSVTTGAIYQALLLVNGVTKKNTYNTFNFIQDYMQTLNIDIALNAGDQVKISVMQNSGGIKNLVPGASIATFSGHQLY